MEHAGWCYTQGPLSLKGAGMAASKGHAELSG
jgi:hypothetical protein